MNLFYAAQPELETYRRNIYKIRRRKAHILSPEEESSSPPPERWRTARKISPASSATPISSFPAVTDGEGNERFLTSGTFVPLLMGGDREAAQKRLPLKLTITASANSKNRRRGARRAVPLAQSSSRTRGTILHRAAALDVTEVPVEVYEPH